MRSLKQQGVKYVNLRKYDLPPEITGLVTKEIVEEHGIIPVIKKGRNITVAASTILEYFALDNLRFLVGSDVDWVMAPASHIEEAKKKVLRHWRHG